MTLQSTRIIISPSKSPTLGMMSAGWFWDYQMDDLSWMIWDYLSVLRRSRGWQISSESCKENDRGCPGNYQESRLIQRHKKTKTKQKEKKSQRRERVSLSALSLLLPILIGDKSQASDWIFCLYTPHQSGSLIDGLQFCFVPFLLLQKYLAGVDHCEDY